MNLEPDELRIIHLGTLQYFLGSVLSALVFNILRGSPRANMEKVWRCIVDEYKDIGATTQYS
eukprot:15434734-Alexandrium_andersonii.AAC.1